MQLSGFGRSYDRRRLSAHSSVYTNRTYNHGANWASNNTLFAIWIGINDVGTSSGWTNISQLDAFHTVLMNYLTTQLDILYESGAHSFRVLLLTVPTTDRAPLTLQHPVVAKLHGLLADYNKHLKHTALKFQAKHASGNGKGEGQVQITLFDTEPIFNTLLNNTHTLEFVNQTGFCEAYHNGTPELATQTPPCAPVSSYFWLNTLYPLFTIHDVLARAISTVSQNLSALSSTMELLRQCNDLLKMQVQEIGQGV
ncbi:hypothetical protein BYT27DRAFT_6531433 [Phlegmacium glaucopus]|nr:hypothetical protein BYT27DRAFT_6531433 [Phlegmacium glaucopus]